CSQQRLSATASEILLEGARLQPRRSEHQVFGFSPEGHAHSRVPAFHLRFAEGLSELFASGAAARYSRIASCITDFNGTCCPAAIRRQSSYSGTQLARVPFRFATFIRTSPHLVRTGTQRRSSASRRSSRMRTPSVVVSANS